MPDPLERAPKLNAALRIIAGGDHPTDAVRERRCIAPPIGCGQPIPGVCREAVGKLVCVSAAGHDGEHTTDDHYTGNLAAWQNFTNQTCFDEWLITGMCQHCQDAFDAMTLEDE